MKNNTHPDILPVVVETRSSPGATSLPGTERLWGRIGPGGVVLS